MDLARIAPERIFHLGGEPNPRAEYVLYWMQQSQRARWNHALEYALARANSLNKRLLVLFVLNAAYPEANVRHYHFMLEGLVDVARDLKKRGIAFRLQTGSPLALVSEAAKNAASVVFDRGYLRHQRQWRIDLRKHIACEIVEIEADAVVPVETASLKREYAARTIRKKILSRYEDFLLEPEAGKPEKPSAGLTEDHPDCEQIKQLLGPLNIDRTVPAVSALFHGGTAAALKRLKAFVDKGLPCYDEGRNDPSRNDVSGLSPYLHFGQIAPAHVAQRILNSAGDERLRTAFLEQLIVRRELAINFVWHEKDYASFSSLPQWAAKTLTAHKEDRRPYHYSRTLLEAAATHDRAWNAAMLEMKHTGYMHNRLRMYWGKKIIEWSNTPQHALRVILSLNNKYFLDGRDASSYANILWLFGLHDRPWQEWDVFGTVRYMSQRGLEQKVNVPAYVEKVMRCIRDLGIELPT